MYVNKYLTEYNEMFDMFHYVHGKESVLKLNTEMIYNFEKIMFNKKYIYFFIIKNFYVLLHLTKWMQKYLISYLELKFDFLNSNIIRVQITLFTCYYLLS